MERKLNLDNGRFCFVTDDGKVFNEKHKELKIQVDKAGYCSAFLYGEKHLVHRIVYSAFVREIRDGEHIHHINGSKKDNGIENLSAMSMKEHQHLHKQIYPIIKICKVCGKEFIPHKTKRKRAKTCSHECWLKITRENAKARKVPIIQMDIDGKEIKTWDSARDIQNSTGYFESNINKCCNGKIRSYKGYKRKYA